jgi:hypothetical protein
MEFGDRFGAVSRVVLAVTGAAVLALAVSGATGAVSTGGGVQFSRVISLGVGTYTIYGMTRTSDGTLHLIFQTSPGKNAAPDGIGTNTISAAGTVGGQVAALHDWGTSIPGLIRLPNGNLVSVFGAVGPKPDQISGLWGITSTDGGSTWSAPVVVGNQATDEAHAYGANVTGEVSGSKPVFMLSVAGGIIAQKGLGKGVADSPLTDSGNGSAGDVDSALDAGTKEVVVSWASLAGKGGDFIRGAAPALQGAVHIPGRTMNEVVISGRDTGPGVFAAYSNDGTHVRLFRYGGGSVAVGSVPGVTAKVLGTATGLDGRIWVMWGDDNAGLAVTRSNKAVTRFEPIQQVNPHAFSLFRIGGDGRLGPLDLLVEEIPVLNKKVLPPGTLYGRVLPELSGTESTATLTKNGQTVGYKLTVHVTDAGDAVSGATVSAGGKTAKTAGNGIATITLPASTSGKLTITVTAPGYQPLSLSATI